MRFQIFVIGVVVALALFFLMPFAISVTQAQSNPPTPQPKAAAQAPSSTQVQYKVYLPVILTASAPTPPPATPSKKGVPLTYSDCPTVGSVKGSWEYAWSATPPSCTGIENVPMIFGWYDINYTPGGNSEWLMGFNEPDLQDQANLSISQAVQLWRQLEQKHPNRKLLAPAPSGGNPDWIVNFRNAYISAYGAAPRLNGLAVHCYAWYASQCITHTLKFKNWATAWGVSEIWVTEFSFSPTSPSSPNQALQEARTFISWMASESKITRYAWFASQVQGNEAWLSPYFVTPLVQWNSGQLTAFGNEYLTH